MLTIDVNTESGMRGWKEYLKEQIAKGNVTITKGMRNVYVMKEDGSCVIKNKMCVAHILDANKY